jgi:hypothetical protein
MPNIVAGRFEQEEDAAAAVAVLLHHGFPRDRVASFFLNRPGQHATFPIGGDRVASPGAKAAGVGAYVGALTGALAKMEDRRSESGPGADGVRRAGFIVAVYAPETRQQASAMEVLRIVDIDRADGHWRDGEWIDFDPLRPPRTGAT